MKKLMIISFTFMLLILVVGCGKKDEVNDTSKKEDTTINEQTKVSTMAASYNKYIELKGDTFDKMNESIPEEDYLTAVNLLGFSMVDLAMLPIVMCGLKESEVANFYALYNNLDYKYENNKCSITFKSDGESSSYVSIYDQGTDSVQTKMYTNDELQMITEYVKLDKGYGAQQYYVDGDNSSIYRTIFSDNYMAIGIFQNATAEPSSIFKAKNLTTKEWTQGGTSWTEYDNGKVTTIPNN